MSAVPSTLTLPGSWENAFALRTPLPMQSKSNFRRHKGGATSSSSSSSWASAREFERSLGLLVRAARPAGWVVGERESALAERPVVVAFIAARSTVDVANFSKSVLDACENVLYVSDASVLGVGSVGTRGRGQEILLGFAQLAPGASASSISAALNDLSSAVLQAFPEAL